MQKYNKKIIYLIFSLLFLLNRTESKENKANELLNYFNQSKISYSEKAFNLLNDFIKSNDTLKKILFSKDSIIHKNLKVKIIPNFILNENSENFNCQDSLANYISIPNDTSFFDASFYYEDKFILKIFKSKNDISFDYEDYYHKFSNEKNGYFFMFDNFNYFKDDFDLTFYLDGFGIFFIKNDQIYKDIYFNYYNSKWHENYRDFYPTNLKDFVITVDLTEIFNYSEGCNYFVEWISYVSYYETHKNDFWYKIFKWKTFNNNPEYTFEYFEFIDWECDHPGKKFSN